MYTLPEINKRLMLQLMKYVYLYFFSSYFILLPFITLSPQSSDLIAFHAKFHRQSWKLNRSQKICELAFARLQGKGELIAQFLKRNNRVTIPTEYQPLCYHVSGPQKGTIEKNAFAVLNEEAAAAVMKVVDVALSEKKKGHQKR